MLENMNMILHNSIAIAPSKYEKYIFCISYKIYNFLLELTF